MGSRIMLALDARSWSLSDATATAVCHGTIARWTLTLAEAGPDDLQDTRLDALPPLLVEVFVRPRRPGRLTDAGAALASQGRGGRSVRPRRRKPGHGRA